MTSFEMRSIVDKLKRVCVPDNYQEKAIGIGGDMDVDALMQAIFAPPSPEQEAVNDFIAVLQPDVLDMLACIIRLGRNCDGYAEGSIFESLKKERHRDPAHYLTSVKRSAMLRFLDSFEKHHGSDYSFIDEFEGWDAYPTVLPRTEVHAAVSENPEEVACETKGDRSVSSSGQMVLPFP